MAGLVGASTFGGGGGGSAGAGIGSAAGGIAGSYFGPIGSTVGSSLGGAVGGAIDAPASPSTAISGGNPLFSDRAIINIAPVGVNVGEIFRNFEGPRENGGLSLTRRNRFLGDDPAATLVSGSLPLGLEAKIGGSGNIPILLIVAAGGGLLLWFALR